ncbi:MAG TPA: hypothetical protein VLB68_11065 [Pyrinomonadaceae bacterium]|nr:hypothetical protein [Pyrinomonadaceae bacterium]
MRHYITRLFLILAILTPLMSVSAQSHDRGSSQPASKEAVLTERLIFVFEWILEAHFTQVERAELQRIVEEYSRSASASDQKALQNIAELQQKIDNIPADRVVEMRAAIQTQVLKQMRDQPNDPTARLILSVYERTHQKPAISQASQPVVDRRSAGIPAELVGQWIARRGSGSMYQNQNNGSFSAPEGTIDSYKLFADGTYEHAILMQNSLYNCTIRVFGRETGKLTASGSTLTLAPGPGTLEYTDSCRSQMNSKKATQMDSQVWQWQLTSDEQGAKLCVVDSKNASACYYKQ